MYLVGRKKLSEFAQWMAAMGKKATLVRSQAVAHALFVPTVLNTAGYDTIMINLLLKGVSDVSDVFMQQVEKQQASVDVEV